MMSIPSLEFLVCSILTKKKFKKYAWQTNCTMKDTKYQKLLKVHTIKNFTYNILAIHTHTYIYPHTHTYVERFYYVDSLWNDHILVKLSKGVNKL